MENDYERSECTQKVKKIRTSLILSRKSLADLKTGMASPMTAPLAPKASIGGRDGRVDWESCWGARCTDWKQLKLL